LSGSLIASASMKALTSLYALWVVILLGYRIG
jgi:hypothetical protein